MGVFGIDTFRERSLIPPDDDDNPDCIMAEETCSEHLIRRTFKDGHIEWTRLPHDLDGYDEDCYEEAYAMGVAATDRAMRNLRTQINGAVELGYSLGAYQAAELFARRRGQEDEK